MQRTVSIFLFAIVAFLRISSASAQDFSIRIGAVLPFTGELGYVGQDIREGIELALAERGDRKPKIDVIWEDGKFAPKESVTAAQKLITNDKVDFIVSLWDTADVIAPVTEKSKVIQLSIRWNPDVAAKFRYTFTFESTFPTYYSDIVKLIKAQDLKTAVFFHEETQAGIRERESFLTSAKAAGIEVLGVESFQTGEADFRSSITRLLNKKPDIFVNEGFPPASEILLKQLRMLNPGGRHIGFYEAISDTSLIENQPFVSQIGFLPEFAAKFEKKFGHPFRVRAPHGYELIRMVDWAYRNADSKDKPSTDVIKDKLSTLKDFESVLGKLSVNGTRNIEHPNTFKIFRNGKLELFTK